MKTKKYGIKFRRLLAGLNLSVKIILVLLKLKAKAFDNEEFDAISSFKRQNKS